MTMLRIFLSYGDTDAIVAEQLKADLQKIGVEVVGDSSTIPDEKRLVLLSQQLSQCQWLILLQTSAALQSSHMQATMIAALNLVAQQRMQGVLRIVPSSLDTSKQLELGNWTSSHEIEFDGDYQKLWNRILLKVVPMSIQMAPVAPPDTIFPISLASKSTLPTMQDRATPLPPTRVQRLESPLKKILPAHQPRRHLWLAACTMILILIVIVASFVANEHGKIHATATPTPTPTTTSIPTPTPTSSDILARATSGQPFINDRLQFQNDNKWFTDSGKTWSCAFTNGAYHVSAPAFSQDLRPSCLENAYSFGDFAYQVDMRLLQGDEGGIIFHAQGRNAYYWFSLDAQGCYALHLEPSKGVNPSDLLPNRTCPHFDMHGTKQLTVIVLSGNIHLYVDGQGVDQTNDSTIHSGQVGVMCLSRKNATSVAFSSAKIWKLS